MGPPIYARVSSTVLLVMWSACRPPTSEWPTRAMLEDWERQQAADSACASRPLVGQGQSHTGITDLDYHRDPATGQRCTVWRREFPPRAFVIDSTVYCPHPHPATWRATPPAVASVDLAKIESLEVSRDSTTLAGLGCAVTPRYVLSMRTKKDAPVVPGRP